MMLSKSLLTKITSDVDLGDITKEEIMCESERLGLPVIEIIRLLFDFLIEYRFTSKGY